MIPRSRIALSTVQFVAACAMVVGMRVHASGSAQPSLAAQQARDFDHSLYNKLLQARVANGKVDYRALSKNRAELQVYLGQAASVSRRMFDGWSEDAQIAFLLNLYNAATLDLVLENYPVASIKKIGGLFRSPWSLKRVRLFGDLVSLDHIEHEILRKNYKRPEIHFAMVCAAKGCPPLRAEAYTGERLGEQLASQGAAFLGDPEKNRIDLAKSELRVSKIFDWFEDDFVDETGSIIPFLARYWPQASNPGEAALARLKIRHTDYDWSLNER